MVPAWSKVTVAIVVALGLVPPAPATEADPINFGTPSLFSGRWTVENLAIGYLYGEATTSVTVNGQDGEWHTYHVLIGRADNDIIQTAQAREIADDREQFSWAKVRALPNGAWGLAIRQGDALVRAVEWSIEETVMPGASWDSGHQQDFPRPRVRDLEPLPGQGLAIRANATQVAVTAPFSIELYGFTGEIQADGEVSEFHSGRQRSARAPSGDEVHVISYVRITASTGEALINTTWGQSRFVSESVRASGSGQFMLRDVVASSEALAAGETDANGTWQGRGRLAFETLSAGEHRGRVAGTWSGQFQEIRLDGQTVDLAPGAIATAAATGGIIFGIAILIKHLYAAALFTRLSAKEALEHPRRQALLDYIHEHPGATFRELCRATGIPAGTCRHHLSVLDRSQVIVEHRHRSTVRFFENHGKFDKNWHEIVMLRDPELDRLHGWIKENEETVQKDILEHALVDWGWSRSTTQHRLQRLVENDLVEIHEMGRRKLYSVIEREEPEPPRAFGLRV